MPTTPRRANKAAVQGALFLSQVVARNIRDLRQLRRLQQDELAEKMVSLGHETWSRATVSQVENNGRTVTIDEVLSLAIAFAVKVPAVLDPLGVTGDQTEDLDYSVGIIPARSASAWVRGHLVISLNESGKSLTIRGEDAGTVMDLLNAMQGPANLTAEEAAALVEARELTLRPSPKQTKSRKKS